MMKLPHALLSLCLITSAFACSAPATDVDSDEGEVVLEEKPVGTFEAGNLDPRELGLHVTRLVLKTDGTFYRETDQAYEDSPWGDDTPGGVVVAHEQGSDEGTFKITKSTNSDQRYILLNDAKNERLARYAFTLDTPKHTLELIDTTSTRAPVNYLGLAKAAYCAVQADCGLQNVPTPRCAGAWACETNACAYRGIFANCDQP